MAQINVKLEASYGYGCSGCGYGSEEDVMLEVADNELEVLRKLGKDEVTRDEVLEAIACGDNALEELHNRIQRACFGIMEEYWLFEAYNECLEDSLRESFDEDVEAGIYTSISFEEFVEMAKSGDIDFEALHFGDFLDNDIDFEYEDDVEYRYDSYVLSCYYDWVCEHDHWFVAERVGVDLDACHDEDIIDYTISLK